MPLQLHPSSSCLKLCVWGRVPRHGAVMTRAIETRTRTLVHAGPGPRRGQPSQQWDFIQHPGYAHGYY